MPPITAPHLALAVDDQPFPAEAIALDRDASAGLTESGAELVYLIRFTCAFVPVAGVELGPEGAHHK